jgi:hypothetical protein
MAVVPQMPAQQQVEDLKARLRQSSISQLEKDELAKDTINAMYALANDLIYPTDADGDVIDIRYFAPLIAYHLSMCGWRKDPDKVQRVRQKAPGAGEPGTGVAEDAIEWVDPGIRKQGRLPLAFRKDAPPEKPGNIDGWHIKPHIKQTMLEEGEY